jgi:hypothetical protein
MLVIPAALLRYVSQTSVYDTLRQAFRPSFHRLASSWMCR